MLRLQLLLTASFAAVFSGPAQAQDISLEEIVVTARGREESLSGVPDTLTVFSADLVRRQRIEDLEDLAPLTAGLYMINDQDPGTNIITVRGISTDRLQSPSIAFVVDGVSLADYELFTQPLFDVERIEVLKGPQGALYGKNAIGGVINITTAAPTDTQSGRASLEYGNADTAVIRASASGPLIDDRLLVRVSGLYKTSDGTVYNSFLDRTVDYIDTKNLRVKLKAFATERLTLDLAWQVNDEATGAAWASSGNITGLNGGRLDGDFLTDPFGDFLGEAERHWWSTSAKATYQVSGGGELQWTGGFDTYEKRWIEELDYRNDTPLFLFGLPLFPDGIQPISQPIDLELWTQEVRYTSTSDARLRWIAGAFYQHTLRERIDDFGPLLFGAEPPGFRTKSDQTAVFAQASYDVTGALEVTAALRYDRDVRRETVTGTLSNVQFSENRAVFDDVQPKLSLAWQATDETLIYASVAKGFKPGGFNVTPLDGDIFEQVFDAERTWAFEGGVKQNFWNGRGNLNAAVFFTDYANLQHFLFIRGNSVTVNADQVDVLGFELSGRLTPIEGLTLDAAFAYTDSEIKQFETLDPLTATFLVDYAGNQSPNSPKVTFNFSADYVTPLTDDWDVRARVDYQLRGRTFYEIDNALFSPAQGSANASLGLETETWSLTGWVENISDARWAQSAFGQGQVGLLAGLGPNGPFDTFTINRGRTFGATLSAGF